MLPLAVLDGHAAVPRQVDQLLLLIDVILVLLTANVLDEAVNVDGDGLLLEVAPALVRPRLRLLLLREAKHFLHAAILRNPLLSLFGGVVDLLEAQALQGYVDLRDHAIVVPPC